MEDIKYSNYKTQIPNLSHFQMVDKIHHKSLQCLNLITFCIWAKRKNLNNVNLGKTKVYTQTLHFLNNSSDFSFKKNHSSNLRLYLGKQYGDLSYLGFKKKKKRILKQD